MACRVGMSTDPYESIDYWTQKEGHTHSRILARNLTYEQALAREKKEAEERGCNSKSGGAVLPGRVWYVYLVWGGRAG